MNSETTTAKPAGKHGEEEARRVAEAAREKEWRGAAFVRDLFMGKLRLPLVHPYPDPDEFVRPEARAFLERLERFLVEEVDPIRIDREYRIPDEVIDRLKEMGAFGLKLPKEYGGYGFNQTEYSRMMGMLATRDPSLITLLSAHQSIGLPQPLKLFGTEDQKKRYMPGLAKGEISAFALTENDVGSDPGRLQTTAVPTEDGEAFLLNGEKLWCTNGTIADHIVVMARTPDRKITAFIVERAWPGVEVTHRLKFMGLHGIENAVMTLKDVRVPKENILWGMGKGLKLALVTLNTGRLAVVGVAAGTGKACLEIVRRWASTRVQWGQPVGRHDAVAQMIADIAAHAYAMDAVSDLTAMLSDRGGYDIRLEAAFGKLFTTEHGWRVMDETLQVRGGRGYETEESLLSRGEEPVPVERMFRDFRINRIFEGSSEILRLFIAREAVDLHLKVAGEFVEGKLPFFRKMLLLPKIVWFYGRWYPARWCGWGRWPRYSEFGDLATHVRYLDRTARRLARALFHLMLRHGAGLQKRQALLFRAVDVGSELFAMAASVSRAMMLERKGAPHAKEARELADLFCRLSRNRIAELFGAMRHNTDVRAARVARGVLDGRYEWMEEGIVRLTDLFGDEGKTA